LIGGLGPLFEQRLSPPYRAKLQKPLHDAPMGAVQLAVKNFAPARKEAVHG
ncbi:N-acetylglucosamine kinase, partial [Escherichia coli]|nr:N-acetylglucosamine kinase [Escherichia coli]